MSRSTAAARRRPRARTRAPVEEPVGLELLGVALCLGAAWLGTLLVR